MKLTHALSLCTAMVALSVTGVAQAQDDEITALTRRLEAMQAELDELKNHQTEFVSYKMNEPAQVCGDSCSSAGCCSQSSCCCQEPFCYAAYEMAILKPYISTANFGPSFDDDYGIGHRFIVGRENATGLGVRGRYFFYNQGHDHPGPGLPMTLDIASIDIDMDVADLEVTQRERFCCWDLLLSGGVRYARYDQDINGVPLQLADIRSIEVDDSFRFEGVGPTVALEANRRVGCRGFYLLGNFRTSLLMGDIDRVATQTIDLGNGPVATNFSFQYEDELVVVLENQLGFGWKQSGENVGLDLRAVWETQFWLNDTLNDDENGIGSNLGLSGPTVAAIVSF